MSCNATLLHRRDRTKLNSTSLNTFCHSVYSLVHFVFVVGDVNGPLDFTIAVVVQIVQVNLQFAHCSQILVDVNTVIAIWPLYRLAIIISPCLVCIVLSKFTTDHERYFSHFFDMKLDG